MKTIEVSTCCKAELVEDFKNNPRDHHDPIEIYTCKKCKQECDVEEVCEDCLGSGEIIVMERVYADDIHEAPIGTRTCHCQSREDRDD